MKSRERERVCAAAPGAGTPRGTAAVRRASSSVALRGVEFPHVLQQLQCRRRGIAAATASVSTSGQPARTSAHSTGLSSMNTKLSRPRLSRAASARRFCDFGCQLIVGGHDLLARAGRRSGRVSNTRQTSASSFLLHRHDRARRSRLSRASVVVQRAVRLRRTRRPSAPTSPTTPRHSVLSQSTTTTLRAGASLRCAWRMTIVASTWKYSSR